MTTYSALQASKNSREAVQELRVTECAAWIGCSGKRIENSEEVT